MVRLLSRASFLGLLCILLTSATPVLARRAAHAESITQNSGAGYRFDRGGWKYVHLEGTPAQIGFQHGQLLASEIADLIDVMKLETLHEHKA